MKWPCGHGWFAGALSGNGSTLHVEVHCSILLQTPLVINAAYENGLFPWLALLRVGPLKLMVMTNLCSFFTVSVLQVDLCWIQPDVTRPIFQSAMWSVCSPPH